MGEIKDRFELEVSRLFNYQPYFRKFSGFLSDRIHPILDLATDFYIETYTEREWKELVDIYYINTSYFLNSTFKIKGIHLKLINEVFRIHFFRKDLYLGFITLRPIPVPIANLSFVYPNSKNLIPLWHKNTQILGVEEDEKIFVMSYKRLVHKNDEEIEIETFPFYSQDGMVLACAHADIVMITKYLHKKWNAPFVSIRDIINRYSSFRYKNIPTEGLSLFQIIEIFINSNYPVKYYRIIPNDPHSISREDALFIIDSYIECGIPIMAFVEKDDSYHTITIIGHTLKENGDKRYIIYDDSGAFLKWLEKPQYFISIISKEDLVNYLRFIVFYEPDRVYSNPLQIKKAVEEFHPKLMEKVKKLNRIFLVHNSKVKNFFSKKYKIHKDKINGSYQNFIKSNVPHYLWLIEFLDKNDKPIYLVADPTLHKDDYPIYPFIIETYDKIGLLLGG